MTDRKEYRKARYKITREHELAINRQWSLSHPDQRKESSLKRHGITLSQWEQMFIKQNGLCVICGNWLKFDGSTHVDHDHRSGEVRGLLCHKCNSFIGYALDSTTVLMNAIDYLQLSRY